MIDFKSSRKWSFPLNIILFNVCRLYPFRRKRLWVFGAREGHQYDDNSRFLFEYVNKHKNNIRAVWLTRHKEIATRIQKEGFEAYTVGSWKGITLALRAGVSFYTNGLIDFGTFPLVGGSTVVALWHGMGFKKIYNGKYHGIALMTKKFLDKYFFSWTYRNVTISTSQYANQWLAEMFTLNKKKIFITGQPRNDAFEELNRTEILKKISINSHKKIILYLPTYRQSNLGMNAMKNIIYNLYENESLNMALNNSDAIFITKLHPLTPHIELSNRENFKILDYASVENNQELLGIADILVTDYSSCFIDYAILNRPIIFYVPDEKEFIEKSEDLEDYYFKIERVCRTTTPEELALQLANPASNVSDATNKLFCDDGIKGTCYSENVFNVVSKEIGI